MSGNQMRIYGRMAVGLSLSLFILGIVATSSWLSSGEFLGKAQAQDSASDAHDEHADDAHAHEEMEEDHAEHDHAEDNHDEEEHAEDEHAAHEHAEDPHDEDDHADDAHGSDEEDSHGGALTFTTEELEELSISLGVASPGKLDIQVNLPGEVRLNQDRLAHVVPKLSGIVNDVNVTFGDKVRAGDVMASLESRELASLKAAYLAARERVNLAQATYKREEGLWKEEISAEKDYLDAKSLLAEAQISLRAAQQELEALGLPEAETSGLLQQSGRSLTQYKITAPFGGTIIEKHVALGEFVEENAEIFTLADLSTVWIDLNVYQKDLLAVREGQEVSIAASGALPDARGRISYIGPLVGEETRTALARIVLENPDGLWRPGLFVTARVSIDETAVPVSVPKTALQSISGKTYVFIRHDGEFEPVPVEVGRVDANAAEIVSGLKAGQSYVASGGFHLKAEMEKESFAGDGHAH